MSRRQPVVAQSQAEADAIRLKWRVENLEEAARTLARGLGAIRNAATAEATSALRSKLNALATDAVRASIDQHDQARAGRDARNAARAREAADAERAREAERKARRLNWRAARDLIEGWRHDEWNKIDQEFRPQSTALMHKREAAERRAADHYEPKRGNMERAAYADYKQAYQPISEAIDRRREELKLLHAEKLAEIDRLFGEEELVVSHRSTARYVARDVRLDASQVSYRTGMSTAAINAGQLPVGTGLRRPSGRMADRIGSPTRLSTLLRSVGCERGVASLADRRPIKCLIAF